MSQVSQEAVRDDKCAKGLRLGLLIHLPSGKEFVIDVLKARRTPRHGGHPAKNFAVITENTKKILSKLGVL